MMKWLKKQKTYLLIGYVFLLLIHFGFKDHLYLTGILFYAFPVPILILAIFPLIALFYNKKRIRFTLLGLIGLLSFIWINNQYINFESSNVNSTNSIFLWNIADQKDYNVDVLKKTLEAQRIDALFFVEVLHKDNNFNTQFKQQLHNYNVQFLDGNMMVVAKKGITIVDYIEEERHYKLNHLKVEIGLNTFEVIIVDIFAKPWHNKKKAFTKIYKYLEDHDIDIILGDFNTPYESIYFNHFKTNYTSARNFQKGFSATWPYPVPLLEIDHIWIKKQQTILSTEKKFYTDSDHALLITEFK
ncbi:endonuclease/exonuclease/phosphatase family protein [Winogradskyella helgolandensis]|uniref:endonuclease/exonuclease/phosphatase family protein n=1 Tax=Winogradskyella helgolandensis TaxID=2697010 RepID=UPI0015B7F51A|nr:endonuclease/exonuclease/phosphatase family protein [Winogradskyella helgolandensis]